MTAPTNSQPLSRQVIRRALRKLAKRKGAAAKAAEIAHRRTKKKEVVL